MFENILKFFIANARMNYLLFIIVFLTGIYSYIKIPKEIFPSFELDMIAISGGYSGASINSIDNMAVKPIEDKIKNIDGIKEMSTYISPTSFTIILELEKRVEKYNTANKIKDAIGIAKQYFPSDMNDPIVNVLSTGKFLMNIAISSDQVGHDELIKKAKMLKDKISLLKDISGITIYGDSKMYYDISLNNKKIASFGLNERDIITALRGLSYTFPVGKIEDSKNGHFYISTNNGKKTAKAMLFTQLKIQDKSIYLKDIASIDKRYADATTLFSVDGKDAIALSVNMSEVGNALTLAKDISTIILNNKKQDTQIEYLTNNDQSIQIKNRLNTVISNILLGVILITLLVMVLINTRMSFVIFLGIPTSFLIGVFYLHLSGNTINMISLIGVLIALGIIVDDAIVVSENIQQYVEKGIDPKEAALLGSKEMFKPVTIASLTTLFAFIPALLIGGVMGEVIKLIPITVSILVFASLVEAFIFLPIHSAHILTEKSKPLNWNGVNKYYRKVLHFFIKNKKSFLFLFFIIIPIFILFLLSMSKFKMFPRYDTNSIKVILKANVQQTNQETDRILKTIQKELLNEKIKFNISHVSTIAGWRLDSSGNGESYPYVGQLEIELEKLEDQNFIESHITPLLSFYKEENNGTREKKSFDISREVRAFIKEKKYKNRFNLIDIEVIEQEVYGIQPDIKIEFISNDMNRTIQLIKELKKKLLNIKGVVSADDSIKYGLDEIKLKVNTYGESLGVDEQSLGELLSSFYLDKKILITYDKGELIEVYVHSNNKNSLTNFKNFELDLGKNGRVALKDVVEFQTIKSFEKVVKNFGVQNLYMYANLDGSITTSLEVIKEIEPLLEKIKKEGIKIKFAGEQKDQEELAKDMMAAALLAIMLIMLSLLYLVNSFRETFMMLSVIPFSLLGVLVGHQLLGINLSLPSLIGILGLSGIVINDGIIMIMSLKKASNIEEIYKFSSKRFRPIILTSVTTIVGLSSLILFSSGQAVIFQPMAISIGFGLLWGTVLNLIYLPVLFVVLNRKFLENKD